MATPNPLSYLGDEEEELARLLESSGQVSDTPPPAAPELEPEPVPTIDMAAAPPMEERISFRELPNREPAGLEALAMRGQRSTLPEPPEASGPSKGGLIAAGLLDLALNRGRNTGALLGQMSSADDAPYETYKRKMDHEQALAEIGATNRRGTYGARGERGLDPESIRLRDEANALRERQIALSEGKYANAQADQGAKRDINSEETASAQEIAISLGMPEEEARKYTAEQIEKWRPQIAKDAQQLRTQKHWRERFAAQQGATVAKEERGEERKIEGEERTEGRTQTHRAQDFAQKFAKDRELELDVAGLLQDIESAPGGVPPGFFERFRNTITARGIDPERLDNWQAKQMVLELWARNQTGAAISQSEDGRFITQVGLNPTASNEQVEAAFNVMKRLTTRRLRGYAAANPEAARGIASEYGLSDEWIGGVKPAVKTKAKSAPASGETPSDGDAPAKTRGIRKGKPVRKVLHGTGPNGQRVRVVLYADGSREVVQ